MHTARRTKFTRLASVAAAAGLIGGPGPIGGPTAEHGCPFVLTATLEPAPMPGTDCGK